MHFSSQPDNPKSEYLGSLNERSAMSTIVEHILDFYVIALVEK